MGPMAMMVTIAYDRADRNGIFSGITMGRP